MPEAEDSSPGTIRDSESDREFIFKAVHEFRESLRTIRTNSELLATKYGPRGANIPDNLVAMVVTGVDRMEKLINDLAEYCYVETSDQLPSTTDMNAVLREALAQLADEIHRAGAIVSHDDLPSVTGDFGALTAVFRIFFENSCKFRSDAPPRIHVGVERHGTNWEFSVKDDGLGFEPAYQNLVFEPFERLNGRRYPGSGLGLFVARRILEQHHGAIWAESQPGAGSTFRFRLPATDESL